MKRYCGGNKGFIKIFSYPMTNNVMFFLVQNDKLELLKTGSLQHLGENMLAFLLHIGASSHIPEGNSTEAEEDISKNSAIYFDILVLLEKKFGLSRLQIILQFYASVYNHLLFSI